MSAVIRGEVGMAYASSDLVQEHEGILFGLKILEKMASMIESHNATRDSSPPREDLAGMVDFLKLFADKCHHGKEEGLLFPALEAAGVRRDGGPIGQMLAEHVEGRRLIAAMADALDAGPDLPAFAAAARRYIDLLRAHIGKENGVLFPLADRALPAAIQSELLEKFEKHELVAMGPGTHERLHGELGRFERKYLA